MVPPPEAAPISPFFEPSESGSSPPSEPASLAERYAIETDAFGSIRRRMYNAIPCAKLLIAFDYDGILLEAKNFDGEGFSLECIEGLVLSYIFAGDEERSLEETKEIPEDIGAEAAAIVMKFLEKVKCEIGEFHVKCRDWDWGEPRFQNNVEKYQKQFMQVFEPNCPSKIGTYIMEIVRDPKPTLTYSNPSTDFYSYFIGPTGPEELIPDMLYEISEEFRSKDWAICKQKMTEILDHEKFTLAVKIVVKSFATSSDWCSTRFYEEEELTTDALYCNEHMPDTAIRLSNSQELIVDVEGARYTFRKIVGPRIGPRIYY